METKLSFNVNDTDAGSLRYLVTCSHPNIAYAVGQLSRYLVGTKSMCIEYSTDKQLQTTCTLIIDGFCDSDWGNDPDTRKSVTGYVHFVAGGAVCWASTRQTIVAQSTAEAEYVAAYAASMEGQGLRNVFIEVFPALKTAVHLGIDNQTAYVMATNPTFSRRTRHIELR
ncbi:hypothetical protein PHMEG_00039423 [Phytophthora megakarya]|uniref:Polyprotein n=1 Tax=Phytophthora megakarya TaxID=4795 RepID=A0A225UFH9_9STRA|nr:hypothetical protein PHMEG_00039423 [Phytophthora megakarya]